MNWFARYRADYRALRALDGGRSPIAAALVEAAVLVLMVLDVLAVAAFVPVLIGLAVAS